MNRMKVAGAHRRKRTAEAYKDIAIQCHEWSQQGISQEDQADMLNAMGKRMGAGGKFSQAAISQILKRALEYGHIPEPTMPE